MGAKIDEKNLIHTRIWEEIPQEDNAFSASKSYCRGYDVLGELVGNVSWIEMLLLLYRDERFSSTQIKVFESLAVALANPGPRDTSVHAAMAGAVGGSPAAASLIAAISAGAGRLGGSRDLFEAMRCWYRYGNNIEGWRRHYEDFLADDAVDAWPRLKTPPGCDPYGASTPLPVIELLEILTKLGAGENVAWLTENHQNILTTFGVPLTMIGVAAAVFVDMDFTPEEGEMLCLLLRLPGAAAHAIEQRSSFSTFPFYPVTLVSKPSTEENS